MLVLVAACGGAADGPADPGDPGSPAPADPGSDGDPVVLTMWFNGETVPPDAFRKLEEEHNIIVNFDIRGDDILPLMQQMRDAGEPLPDIIEIDTNTVPAYIEAGAIRPIDDLVELWAQEDPELFADIPQIAWDNGTFDGQIYHHANKAGFDLMYYNLEMVEAVGIELPILSHHDITEAALLLQDAFPGLPEYYGNGGTSSDRMFQWSYAFDLPWIGEQGNMPDLNTPQGYAMIEWLRDIFEAGIVNPEYMIGDQDESQGAFASGQLPLLLEGSNGGIAFAEGGWTYGDDYLTSPMPPLGTGDESPDGWYMMVPRGLSIAADTAHPYEASLVLRYLQEPEQLVPRVTELFASPILSNSLFDAPEFTELYPWFTPEIVDAMMTTPNQIPPGTNTLAVGEVLKNLLDELTVVGTNESAEDLAARYVERMLALDN